MFLPSACQSRPALVFQVSQWAFGASETRAVKRGSLASVISFTGRLIREVRSESTASIRKHRSGRFGPS